MHLRTIDHRDLLVIANSIKMRQRSCVIQADNAMKFQSIGDKTARDDE